jgi:hypothetical protein
MGVTFEVYIKAKILRERVKLVNAKILIWLSAHDLENTLVIALFRRVLIELTILLPAADDSIGFACYLVLHGIIEPGTIFPLSVLRVLIKEWRLFAD